MRTIPVGTRVVAEGPFGTFTESFRRGPKELLIAGGIGITPVRALAERMDGDLVVIHRVLSEADIVFRDELVELAARRGFELHYVVGDHTADGEPRAALEPRICEELVPDIAERDVYVCGPPAMVAWRSRTSAAPASRGGASTSSGSRSRKLTLDQGPTVCGKPRICWTTAENSD